VPKCETALDGPSAELVTQAGDCRLPGLLSRGVAVNEIILVSPFGRRKIGPRNSEKTTRNAVRLGIEQGSRRGEQSRRELCRPHAGSASSP
jgi:hypothetical protein